MIQQFPNISMLVIILQFLTFKELHLLPYSNAPFQITTYYLLLVESPLFHLTTIIPSNYRPPHLY